MKYTVDGTNAVFLFEHSKLNCQCIIAKNTQVDLPGLGGTRFIPYKNISEATNNAKILSSSMLYKNAIAKLPFTGAKQIIFCKDDNIGEQNRKDILSFSADCVNSLKGDFITGTDMGITPEDVSLMAKFSPYILDGEAGNTSYDTAVGIMEGLLNMLKVIMPHKNKSDLRVLLQGVGKVGSHVAKLLYKEGMQIYISETDCEKGQNACNTIKAIICSEISQFKGDIFMPCALENSVNYELAKNMGVSIVAGGANNQLRDSQDDSLLAKNGIFYAPDFVINSGGTIHAAASYLNWTKNKLLEKLQQIPEQLKEIYEYALRNDIGTYQAAKKYALESINISHL